MPPKKDEPPPPPVEIVRDAAWYIEQVAAAAGADPAKQVDGMKALLAVPLGQGGAELLDAAAAAGGEGQPGVDLTALLVNLLGSAEKVLALLAARLLAKFYALPGKPLADLAMRDDCMPVLWAVLSSATAGPIVLECIQRVLCGLALGNDAAARALLAQNLSVLPPLLANPAPTVVSKAARLAAALGGRDPAARAVLRDAGLFEPLRTALTAPAPACCDAVTALAVLYADPGDSQAPVLESGLLMEMGKLAGTAADSGLQEAAASALATLVESSRAVAAAFAEQRGCAEMLWALLPKPEVPPPPTAEGDAPAEGTTPASAAATRPPSSSTAAAAAPPAEPAPAADAPAGEEGAEAEAPPPEPESLPAPVAPPGIVAVQAAALRCVASLARLPAPRAAFAAAARPSWVELLLHQLVPAPPPPPPAPLIEESEESVLPPPTEEAAHGQGQDAKKGGKEDKKKEEPKKEEQKKAAVAAAAAAAPPEPPAEPEPEPVDPNAPLSSPALFGPAADALLALLPEPSAAAALKGTAPLEAILRVLPAAGCAAAEPLLRLLLALLAAGGAPARAVLVGTDGHTTPAALAALTAVGRAPALTPSLGSVLAAVMMYVPLADFIPGVRPPPPPKPEIVPPLPKPVPMRVLMLPHGHANAIVA